MPGYGGIGKAALLRENEQRFLFQNELVAVGTLSIAYELARINRSFYPWGLSAEVSFSGNPGAFEIDIMGANNDSAANYISLGTITAVNGTLIGRWDMPSNLFPKYVAAFVKTLANATVLTTLQVTR
jgi:hypothetical protein